MADESMIDVRLSRVVMRDDCDQQWIFLTEEGGHRGFPIIIGSGEAHEIRRVLTDLHPPRPLTHQLAHATIEALGGKLEGVDIVDLRDNTFYAALVLSQGNGKQIRVDARPSDALALGLRAGCPIRVAESVLEQVRSDEAGPDPLPSPESYQGGADPQGMEPGTPPEDPPGDPEAE